MELASCCKADSIDPSTNPFSHRAITRLAALGRERLHITILAQMVSVDLWSDWLEKGDSLFAPGEDLKNAAWYYPEPLDGAQHIKDHVAFCMYTTIDGA